MILGAEPDLADAESRGGAAAVVGRYSMVSGVGDGREADPAAGDGDDAVTQRS